MTSPVTAVGRMLTPRHGEPHRHRVIAVRQGSVRTVTDRVISRDNPPESRRLNRKRPK